MDNQKNKEYFLSKGLKNTKNRNFLFAVLENTEVPLTAEDIYLKLREKGVSINLSTVYRILDVFVSKELITRSSLSDNKKNIYELYKQENKHRLVCISCKKVQTLNKCPLEKFEKELEKEISFDITSHKLELYGYCQECKNKK
jgi:Fur family ferric uptake transcriptional regulator